MFSAALRDLSRSSQTHVAVVACALVLIVSSLARADAASGTYTGSLALRGNYWWEDSTRVVAPSAAVTVASPSGVRVEGSYLLDAITSASIAAGAGEDVAFTEKRNEVQAGLGYEVDFGEQQLDVSARGRFSKEPDYLSRGVGFGAALSLDQRNTVLHLNGYFVHDDVYRNVRGGPANRASSREYLDNLDVVSLGVGWDQVLDASTTLTLGYDLSYLKGFQTNAYRQVSLADGPPRRELHPDERARHAGYLWLARYLTSTRTAFRGGYRLYVDSWDLLAHAVDVRVHQEIGRYFETRLRYRYYTQGTPFFYRSGGNFTNDPYVTADPKMSPFDDHTLGLKMRLSLAFLAFTALDALNTAVVDWSVEYVFSSNPYNGGKYGDGVIAQGGLLWPF